MRLNTPYCSKRRQVLIALGTGALAAPFGISGQQPRTVRRIGFLGPTSASGMASRVNVFRESLRELGHVEGRNLVIEYRWAEGKYDRLPELAAELVRLGVEAIVTPGPQATRAAKQATKTIPIVMTFVSDPVALGIVASLARHGGNITGMTYFGSELAAKRLALLKEIFPLTKRVALFSAGKPGPRGAAIETAAKSLGLELQRFRAPVPGEFESTFAEIAKSRVDAITINEGPIFVANAKAIGEIASRQRFPSIGFTEIAAAGGLIGYGINVPELYRRAAYFVDRILKGAKPADLPIEQPTRFELVINMKTAKALGITVPQSILAQADRVIE